MNKPTPGQGTDRKNKDAVGGGGANKEATVPIPGCRICAKTVSKPHVRLCIGCFNKSERGTRYWPMDQAPKGCLGCLYGFGTHGRGHLTELSTISSTIEHLFTLTSG